MPKWEDFKHAASHEDCVKYDLNPNLRDNCSALLIPLQICRVKENYMPWKCKHERHEYERCQFMDFKMRQRALHKLQLKELLEKRAAEAE